MSVEGEYESDLKQFMIYMMSSQDGDVPLLAQTVAGNSSDKKLFRERLRALKEQIQQGREEYIKTLSLRTRFSVRVLDC